MRRRLNVNEIARRLDRVVEDAKVGQGEPIPDGKTDPDAYLLWRIQRIGLGRMLQSLDDGTVPPTNEEVARLPILRCYRKTMRS